MAVKSTLKRYTTSGYDIIHPQTHVDQIEGLDTYVENLSIDNIADIADVTITSPSTGQALVYDNTTSTWKNGNVAPNNVWVNKGTWKPSSLALMTRVVATTNSIGTSVFGLASSLDKMYPYTDGYFYQNEGAYRVLDTSDRTSITSDNSLNLATTAYVKGQNYLTITSFESAKQTLEEAINNVVDDLDDYTIAHSNAVNPHGITAATIGADTSAEVTAKVNALETKIVGGAPAALDTLNELAASLADNASYATTITNALATKASITSLDSLEQTLSTDLYNLSGVVDDKVNLSDVSESATASKIVKRTSNNYIYGGYFNSNRGNETSAAASYIYDSGDGWMRKKTLANARAELVTSAAVISGLGYTPLSTTGKAADSNKLDNLDSSQFIRSDVGDTAAGNHEFYATDTSGSYSTAAIEIREVGLVATGQSVDAYAPGLSFHWGGRVQNKLYVPANGKLMISGSQNGEMYHTGNLSFSYNATSKKLTITTS